MTRSGADGAELPLARCCRAPSSQETMPISSWSRRRAAAMVVSPGLGWVQQVLVHNPPEWYL